MTEIWTWERFVPGDELGTAPLVYSRELVNMWLEIYPDVIEQEAFSGLANAVTMRAYLSVVTPRPPGNIHARQRLSIFRRPAIDEPLETTVSCAAKELRPAAPLRDVWRPDARLGRRQDLRRAPDP